jgi:transposase
MTLLQNALLVPKLYIGADVHKKSWYIDMRTDVSAHNRFSMKPDFDELFKYVQDNFSGYEVHISYEAGCCGFSLARRALQCGWQTIVCNPADIPKTDKSNYQKTDKIDALNLSKLTHQGLLKSVYIPTEEKEQLSILLRHRNEITKLLRRLKSQIKGMLLYLGIAIPEPLDTPHWSIAFKDWLRGLEFSHTTGKLCMDSKLRQLDLLHKEYLSIGNELRAYCRKHCNNDYYLLKSIPGIGGYLATAIIAECGDIRRFANEKQFSSYVGVVPGIYESAGNNSFKGITPRCKQLLRSYLVEAAWVTLRIDPEMQSYYRKHVGKNPKSVIIKIAHKLVKRILAVIKTNTAYRKNHNLKIDETLAKEIEVAMLKKEQEP